MTTAADYIKQWEGYSGVAYWDVNHWRIGYGSDTEGPNQVPVVQGMTTTTTRAEQNLFFRVHEFQNIAAKAMGAEVWQKLTNNEQIAVTSLTYNYGRLPIKIYPADPEKTAAEIASLQSANGGVNRKRRISEAKFYLTGAHEAKPSTKPVATTATLTGTAATVAAVWTWYTGQPFAVQILLAISIAEAAILWFLSKKLLEKVPDVVIHPVTPTTPSPPDEAGLFKDAKKRRDDIAAALAAADKEVETRKQELINLVNSLQKEIPK